MCDISCTNNGNLSNPIIKSGTVRCRCLKNSDTCFWTKRRQKAQLSTSLLQCRSEFSREKIGGYSLTHCSQKPLGCLNILNSIGSSVTTTDSLLCKKCQRIVIELKVEPPFDNQDWINIDFTSPLRRFVSWSYPVSGARKVTQNGAFQRWRVTFDPRAKIKGSLKWSAVVETASDVPSGIQYIEMCPCSENY